MGSRRILPARSMYIFFAPFTITSVMLSSASSGSIGPSPRISATICSNRRLRSGARQHNIHLCQDALKQLLVLPSHLGRLSHVHRRIQFLQQPILNLVFNVVNAPARSLARWSCASRAEPAQPRRAATFARGERLLLPRLAAWGFRRFGPARFS